MGLDRPASDWKEPRGPHLPDWITRIPGPAWPFLAAAVLVAWRSVSALMDTGPDDPGRILVPSMRIAGSVAATLVGAALFVRHPDASRAHRALALGSALIALGVLGATFRADIRGLLAGLGGGDSSGPDLLTTAYGTLVALAGAGGVFAVARGLDAARVLPSRLPEVWLLAVVLSIPFAIKLIGLAMLASMAGLVDGGAMNLVGSLVDLAEGLAWAMLAVVALVGAHAGEEPAAGWWLAAAAAWGIIGVRLGLTLAGVFLVVVPSMASDAGNALVTVLVVVEGAMWVILLGAFAAGLPATRRPAA